MEGRQVAGGQADGGRASRSTSNAAIEGQAGMTHTYIGQTKACWSPRIVIRGAAWVSLVL